MYYWTVIIYIYWNELAACPPRMCFLSAGLLSYYIPLQEVPRRISTWCLPVLEYLRIFKTYNIKIFLTPVIVYKGPSEKDMSARKNKFFSLVF